jgi:hypothetical protein
MLNIIMCCASVFIMYMKLFELFFSHIHSLILALALAFSVTEMRADEYGVEEQVTVLRPAPVEAYSKDNVFVPPVLAKWLRPHQREGVQFMYECVMGLRGFAGNGCILADDMGLGKSMRCFVDSTLINLVPAIIPRL